MLCLRVPLVALVLALVATPARAQQEPVQAPPIEPRAEPRRSELPESVLRAERQTGGEVLRAESMQRDGREVYRLKVLTPDGRVRIMRDDPRERRREAWRNSRRESLRDPFAERGPAPAERRDPFETADRFRRDDSRDARRDEAADRGAPPPPAELDVPETLPPVERGDRY
jgi:hypothetical protein